MLTKPLANTLAACLAAYGLLLVSPAKADPPIEKPPHIVESLDMKGRMDSGLPSDATENPEVIVKTFFAKMANYPDIRYREFFDPRYLAKHGLTDKAIAFEVCKLQGISNLQVADDKLSALVVLRFNDGSEDALIVRCVDHEGHIYIAPEKGPDPATGMIKPWILRTKVK